MRIFKKHSKLYTAYAKTAVIAAIFLAVAIPFARRMANADTIISFDYTRYLVSVNGTTLGYVVDDEDANQALLEARARLSAEEEGLTLVESKMTLTEVTTKNGVMSETELSNTIYNYLKQEAVSAASESLAYTVRIDDFTVTLSSLDEVEDLFEMVKEKYLESDGFTVELIEEDTGVYSVYKTNFVTADKTVNEAAKVLASEDGEAVAAEDEEITYADGVLSVDFVENIEVITTKEAGNVMTVEEAYEAITKEHAEKGTYTVQSGDCLSSIADKCGLTLNELYAMNEGLDGNSVIYAGDVLTITVPAAEISMEVVEEQSYTESYAGEVQYVDNPNLYTGVENVIQNGVNGERAVVALVTYVNGVEKGREIISQTVLSEPTPKIVERGTMTPPTYLWPVYSTYITQRFGENGGHSGVDIYVPTGTAVKATASGTIVYAGWKGDLGYCVEISHGNGMVTRYGHLSSIAVSYGQWVNQGQVVCYSGSTGRSTGPHLHISMLLWGGLVNPLGYLSW